MSMLSRFSRMAICLGCCIAGQAGATAYLGGVVTALSGLGACHDTHLVPGDTLQDTFALSAATACAGGNAGGTVHGDAATATGGLYGYSVGSSPIPGSSQVAAQLQYMDRWEIHVPAGTPVGQVSIPVVLTLEGTVSPGALSGFNRFLDYSLTIRDLYSAPIPAPPFLAILSMNGSVTATGAFSQTVTGNINFNYYGPGGGLPTMAEVTMSLLLPGLNEGVVDFGNTASIAMVLPAGYSAVTSSGLVLDFAAPVPEPASVAMLLGGLGVLALAVRRRGIASLRARSVA